MSRLLNLPGLAASISDDDRIPVVNMATAQEGTVTVAELMSTYTLSEVIPEVTPGGTATTNYSGKTAYAGYRCTTAIGNITITCVTTSKVLVPTTALALGSFPAYGAGHPGRIAIEPGDGDVRVVLSGAGVVYVGLE